MKRLAGGNSKGAATSSSAFRPIAVRPLSTDVPEPDRPSKHDHPRTTCPCRGHPSTMCVSRVNQFCEPLVEHSTDARSRRAWVTLATKSLTTNDRGPRSFVVRSQGLPSSSELEQSRPNRRKARAFAPPHTSLPDAGVRVFRWEFSQSKPI